MVSLSTHKYFNRAFGKMSRKLIKYLIVVISSARLPPADGSLDDDEFEDLGQSVSRMSHPEGYRITKAAIAGLVGENAKSYEPGKSLILFFFLRNQIEFSLSCQISVI